MWNASPPASPCARCALANSWPGQTLQKQSCWRSRKAPQAYLLHNFRQMHSARRFVPAAGARAEEPAALVRDGGVIANGFDAGWTSCAPSDQLRRLPAGPGGREKRAPAFPWPARAVQQGAWLLSSRSPAAMPTRCRRLPPPPDALKNAERFITRNSRRLKTRPCRPRGAPWPRKWLYEQLILDQLQPHVPQLTRLAQRRWTFCAVHAGRALAHAELVRAAVRPEPCIEIEGGRPPWWRRAWPKPPAAPSSPTTRG